MEDELYRKLDEDGGKKIIMARDRTKDGKDVKRCAMIKDIYVGSSQKVRNC